MEREAFVDVPGGRVFTKTWEPNIITDPTPLILFHDSLGCTELWRDFPRTLAEELARTVIAYDRLGFGKSTERQELPSPRFISEEAEIYFPAIIQALGIHKFDLFGHSVGGGMAIACAAHLPGCRSVITEAAQAFVEERTRDGIRQAQASFQNPQTFDRLTKYHGSKASWVLRAWTDVWLSPEFADWSLATSLRQVRCPVFAIHGERDEYGSRAFPEMIRELTSGEMELIPDCGHVPHREMPELVVDLARAFYARYFLTS